MRIYFVTDVHGSDRCFRKFVNAAKFYNANVLILGGDITGKTIVPIIRQEDGTWKCSLFGNEMNLKSTLAVDEIKKTIRDSGAYPYVIEKNEHEELKSKPDEVKKLFTQLMIEGIQGWITLAEERLKGSNVKCYISPGNDDDFGIDKALESKCSYIINPEEKVVEIGEQHEMITLGYANRTPWNSPREVDEDVLALKIQKMTDKVKDMSKCIFNLHVPPIDTPIDKAPKLDSNFKPVVQGGHIEMISAGSIATRNAIERHQPLAGMHGHIHESVGVARIGSTPCFNPGSEYGSGVIRGLLCQLDRQKIKFHMFTSG